MQVILSQGSMQGLHSFLYLHEYECVGRWAGTAQSLYIIQKFNPARFVCKLLFPVSQQRSVKQNHLSKQTPPPPQKKVNK